MVWNAKNWSLRCDVCPPIHYDTFREQLPMVLAKFEPTLIKIQQGVMLYSASQLSHFQSDFEGKIQ